MSITDLKEKRTADDNKGVMVEKDILNIFEGYYRYSSFENISRNGNHTDISKNKSSSIAVACSVSFSLSTETNPPFVNVSTLGAILPETRAWWPEAAAVARSLTNATPAKTECRRIINEISSKYYPLRSVSTRPLSSSRKMQSFSIRWHWVNYNRPL